MFASSALCRSRAAGLSAALAATLALFALAGCVTTSSSLLPIHSESGDERPCRIDCIWDRNVKIALDTKNHGAELPMLAGRIYFVGVDGKPMTARGTVAINWYDMTTPTDGPPRPLGECVYDSVTLQRMKSTDSLIGVGYTLVASWHTYRPEYKRIKVQITFVPEKGGDPVYASPIIVSLGDDSPVVTQRSSLPVSSLPPEKAFSTVNPCMGPQTPVTSVWKSPR